VFVISEECRVGVHDQARPPLPDAIPAAERDFYLELRRLIDIGGLSVRGLQEATFSAKSSSSESSFYSKSQWSRWINGQSRPPRKAIARLATKLAEDGIDAEHLVDLWDKGFVPESQDRPEQGWLESPRQLPAGVGYFTGRTAELDALTSLADDAASIPDAVIIAAISGTAGVGKTTLAVHWARTAAHRFPDGQIYVNLRGYDLSGSPVAPAEAISDILGTLALPAGRLLAGVDAQSALYRSLLADRRILLILDNARDPDQVRPLLPGTGGSMVIVTSRNSLTSLVAAEGALPLTLDLLSERDAQELLACRIGAQRVAAEPAAAAELLTLCARLPLALCIVTARAATNPGFPLSALTSGLRHAEDRLDALDAGDGTGSVRAAISCSYAELHPAAARMFRLLGLHPGPDVTAAACASLAGVQLPEARRVVAELAGAHLLAEHAPGRFGCHDLIRAYAREQAAASESQDDRQEAVHRLLDHYLHTADTAASLIDPTRDLLALPAPAPGVVPEHLAAQQQAAAWLEAEHKVLVATVTLADGSGFDRHAWQIPWGLADFLDRRGLWHEGVALHHIAVAAAAREGDTAGQIMTLRTLAYSSASLGDYDEASTHCAASLSLCQQSSDRVGEARARRCLAFIADRQGHMADSLSHHEQALRLYQAVGHRSEEARMLNNVGWSHAMLGDYEQARVFCRQAIAVYAELGQRDAASDAWDTLGYAEHHLGNFAEAVACYQRALSMSRDIGSRYYEGMILSHLGDTHHAAGDLEAADRAWREALDILDELHHPDAADLRAKLAGQSSPR
jgi:tetratricopeptide (TPR) repeat protein